MKRSTVVFERTKNGGEKIAILGNFGTPPEETIITIMIELVDLLVETLCMNPTEKDVTSRIPETDDQLEIVTEAETIKISTTLIKYIPFVLSSLSGVH